MFEGEKKMIRRTLVLAAAIVLSSLPAQAAKEKIKVSDWGNAKVKPQPPQGTVETIDELSQMFHVSVEDSSEAKELNRELASDQKSRVNKKHTGSDDLLSDELKRLENGGGKTPALFHLETPKDLEAIFAYYKVA